MPGRCHRFSVDDVDLVQIFDGAIHRERGHEYFGTNVDERTFNAECRALGTSPGAFDFSVTATLIEAEGQRVLVDAGFGSSGPERSGGLPMGLEELGVDPQSIDLVVITHLHLDHTGGLLKEDGSRAFPQPGTSLPPRKQGPSPTIRCSPRWGRCSSMSARGWRCFPACALSTCMATRPDISDFWSSGRQRAC
jgi:hypothetical protein